jgi:uncharacterized protein YdhG (YjbR/CyaY superfamily)
MTNSKFANIDAYIASFPAAIQTILETIRTTIKNAAPHASEDIKYNIPTYVQNGNLIHFAAFKNHIGIYPAPSGNSVLEQALQTYKKGKGSIQFPLDKPIPLELITQIVQARIEHLSVI